MGQYSIKAILPIFFKFKTIGCARNEKTKTIHESDAEAENQTDLCSQANGNKRQLESSSSSSSHPPQQQRSSNGKCQKVNPMRSVIRPKKKKKRIVKI